MFIVFFDYCIIVYCFGFVWFVVFGSVWVFLLVMFGVFMIMIGVGMVFFDWLFFNGLVNFEGWFNDFMMFVEYLYWFIGMIMGFIIIVFVIWVSCIDVCFWVCCFVWWVFVIVII